LDALLKNLRFKGFIDLVVFEGDLKFQPAITTIKKTGVKDILDRYHVSFLSIEPLERENELPKILQNAQIISTPVLHTHTFAVISVAAKNLYGILPVYREKYHHILSEKLLELTKNIKVFSIVDGTIGLHGGSMRMGDPVKTDLIIAGWDPIAVDIVSAKIMGFGIEDVPYLNYIKNSGINKKFNLIGDFTLENLPNYHFSVKTPLASSLDLWFRKNTLTRRLFKYNSIIDKLANTMRRVYTTLVYFRKKKTVFKGIWAEYRDRLK
jgi:uncharacterized protein (DUF362 family)